MTDSITIRTPQDTNPRAGFISWISVIIYILFWLTVTLVLTFIISWFMNHKFLNHPSINVNILSFLVSVGLPGYFGFRAIKQALETKKLEVPTAFQGVPKIRDKPFSGETKDESYVFGEGTHTVPNTTFVFSGAYEFGVINVPREPFPLDLNFVGFLKQEDKIGGLKTKAQVGALGTLSLYIDITNPFRLVQIEAVKELMGSEQGLVGYINDAFSEPLLNTLTKLSREKFLGDSTGDTEGSFMNLLFKELEEVDGFSIKEIFDPTSNKYYKVIDISEWGVQLRAAFLKKRDLSKDIKEGMEKVVIESFKIDVAAIKGDIATKLIAAFTQGGLAGVNKDTLMQAVLSAMDEYDEETLKNHHISLSTGLEALVKQFKPMVEQFMKNNSK